MKRYADFWSDSFAGIFYLNESHRTICMKEMKHKHGGQTTEFNSTKMHIAEIVEFTSGSSALLPSSKNVLMHPVSRNFFKIGIVVRRKADKPFTLGGMRRSKWVSGEL